MDIQSKSSTQGEQEKNTRWLILAYLIIFSLFLCLMANQSLFSNNTPGTDSSVFLTIAKEMHEGKAPYRDFFDHKGPFLYFINFVGYRLAGITGVWLLELISMIISVIFSYKTILSLGQEKEIALCSVIVSYLFLVKYFQGGNLTEEYALPLISISLYLFVNYIQKSNSLWSVIISGSLFGLSLMLRPNMFAVWFVFSAYIVINHLLQKEYATALKYILLFFTGIAIALFPFFFYLSKNNALSDYLYQNFVFNSKYAGSGLSIKVIIEHILGIYDSQLVFLCLVFGFIGIFMRKNNQITSVVYLLIVLSLAVSAVLVAISNTIHGHYYMVFIPIATLSITPVVDFFFSEIDTWNIKGTFKSFLVIIFVFCMSLSNLVKLPYYIVSNVVSNARNGIESFIVDIEKCTENNDSIQIIGNNCQFYLYTDIPNANKYIYDSPIASISEEVHEDFVKEWNENPPSIVVIKEREYKPDISNLHKDWIYTELSDNYHRILSKNEYLVFRKS